MSPKPPPPPPPPVEAGERVEINVQRQRKKRVLTGLKCSSCGGSVDVHEGYTNVVCRFCKTPQAVVGNRGIVRMMVLNKLERKDASEVLRKWFRRGLRKDPALKKEARYQEAFLAWFPFVRARLDAIGWVLGMRIRKKKRGNRWETVREPVERQVERSIDVTMPAADMAEFGVEEVNLSGDAIEPLDEGLLRGRGMVFRPSRSIEETAAELYRRSLSEVQMAHRLDRISFSWIEAIRKHVTVVYYPMWVVRYGFRGRTYQVLVDAEDGDIAYGKAPGNHYYRAFSLVGACGGACFIGSTILQHAGSFLRSENGLVGLGIVGLILSGLVYWGYRQFRHGGVVEEGTGLASQRRYRSLTETVQGVVEKYQ
ncbi:MAG: hypothetical protein LJE93_14190 [Acidobacteria bacterium]|nr:hypothetical protein [Acidobacteriota bacterium]